MGDLWCPGGSCGVWGPSARPHGRGGGEMGGGPLPFPLMKVFKVLVPGARVGKCPVHPLEVVVGNQTVLGISSSIREELEGKECREG